MLKNNELQKTMIVNKKGQGISINVIIIAAIALLVLVILSVLLIRSGGDLVVECNDINGGICANSCSDVGTLYTKYSVAKCELQEQVCCIPIQK
ncbi:MAG: hypothetical protein KKF89_05245 [Nanoarchaeota archaeon]|nr:hypothetical protein [Nanoarchaeota archaeon]MBU1855100.1 hypothetical protein [Nanoarchaeota archaeon]